MERITQYLAKLPPFDRLDPDLLLRVAELARPCTLAKGDWLVRQGARAEGSLFILTAGECEIVAEAEDGERLVGVVHPGEYAGVTGALTGEPHPVGVRAVTPGECLRIPREALEMCLSSPGFSAFFSKALAQRLRKMYGELTLEQSARKFETDHFRRRIADLMHAPAVTCGPDLSVREAARLMQRQGVSSVIVADADRPVGIATESDLVSKVLAADLSASTPVRAIMASPVETITPEAFYYDALLQMVRRGFKHLPVVQAEKLVGIVTLGDLARARGDGALSALDQVERATTVDDLAPAALRIDEVLKALVADGVQPSEILPVVTELYDRLTRRLVDMAIAELGSPPCDWCWLTMGSSGRQEQYMRSDQDNGLIYTGSPESVDGYFAKLAAFVVNGLERCGFAPCPGNVMATNPAWRKSLRDWRFQVITMANRPDPEQIRMATIFLDFRAIAGNRQLAASLLEQVWVAVESVPLFLFHLVRDDLAHAVPIGPFKTLRTPFWGEHKGQINLKADACVHVVDLLRALALQNRVAETSTLGRLRALLKMGVLGRDDAEWLEIAYQTLMRLRIENAVERMRRGEPHSHHIAVSLLTQPQRAALKDALVAVAQLQETVGAALAPGGAL